MDPDACIHRIIGHLTDGDPTEAGYGWSDYADWLSRGGFPADPAALADLDTATNGWMEANDLDPDTDGPWWMHVPTDADLDDGWT